MAVNFYSGVLNQKEAPAIYESLQAQRPSPGYVGRLFVGTDTKLIYRDTGVTWDLIGGGGGVGTVTSVGLSAPNIFNITGSPITSSGTIAMSLANQNSNLVFAGPASGGAGTPSFRSLVIDDIPDLSARYINNQTTVQASSNYNIDGIGVNGTGVNTPVIYNGTSFTTGLRLKSYSSAIVSATILDTGLYISDTTPISSNITLSASRLYANPSSDITGIISFTRGYETVSDTGITILGSRISSYISPLNTKNWTSNIYFGGVIGATIDIVAISGAIGTISKATSLGVTLASGTMSIDTGTLLCLSPIQGTVSNGTYMLIGSYNPLAGNWAISNISGYNNYLGSAATLINQTTDNGTDKLQITGGIYQTGPTDTIMFQGVTTIGNNTDSNNMKLYVYGRSLQSSTNSIGSSGIILCYCQNTTTDTAVSLTGGSLIANQLSVMDYALSSNRTVGASNPFANGLFIFRPTLTGNITLTMTGSGTGKRPVSAVMAMLYAPSGSSSANVITELAAFRTFCYSDNAGQVFTVTNLYGIFLGKSDEFFPSTITNRYGIYQEGSSDVNIFNGEVRFGSNNTVNSSVLNTVTNKIKLNVAGVDYYLLASTSNA